MSTFNFIICVYPDVMVDVALCNGCSTYNVGLQYRIKGDSVVFVVS